MKINEILDILSGMCSRCLINGLITTLYEANTLCEVFDRFRNNKYTTDEEYSNDILYLYNLAIKLHESGKTSLGESYYIYSTLLAADRVDFVECKKEEVVKVNPVNIKKSKKSKEKGDIIDISEVVIS